MSGCRHLVRCLLALALVGWLSDWVGAAVFTVTTTADSGVGSLRDAITKANAAPGSTIHFNVPGGSSILLGSSLPILNANITIQGPGADKLTIHGGSVSRVFFVNQGTAVIQGLRVTGASALGGDGGGGGGGGLGAGAGLFVNAGATAKLKDVPFVANNATGGAGAFTGSEKQIQPTHGRFTFGNGGGGGLGGTGGGGGVGGGGGGGLQGQGGAGDLGGGGGGGVTGTGGSGGGFDSNGQAGSAQGGGGGGAGFAIEGSTLGGKGANSAGKGGNATEEGATGGGGGGGTNGKAGGSNDGPGGNGGAGGGGGGGSSVGNGGHGGDFGGGGGAGLEGFTTGGNGGFGGGGGAGTTQGGKGGFGGGGGTGTGLILTTGPDKTTGGVGGTFGGTGGTLGGGGGAGLGGAVFVRQGGTLIVDGTQVVENSVQGGLGAGDGKNGQAHGAGAFLNGANLTFQGQAHNTLHDSFAGTGGVTVAGPGTTTFLGDHTYTGATTVQGGKLVVNGSLASKVSLQGGTLGGNGSVGGTTIDGGTIAPGNSIGVLTVNGAFAQNGGTYQVEINAAGQSDRIDVNGPATLGGSVAVLSEPGAYTVGQTYSILTATGGVNGNYTGITDDLAQLRAVLLYDPNGVRIVLVNDLLVAGRTPNQLAVAGAIVNAPLGVALGLLDANQIPFALDQLSGEIHASLASVGLETHSLFQRTIAQRLRMGWGCVCSCGEDEECPADGDCRTWASPFGVVGNASGYGNAHGFNYDAVGMTAGLDIWASHYTVLGLALGYANWNNRTDTLGSRGDVDAFQIGFYGFQSIERGWVLANLTYEYDSYRTRRPIDVLGATASGRYPGEQYGTYLEGGYSFDLGAVVLQPITALSYIHLWRRGFNETGAGAGDLSVQSADHDVFRTQLGGRVTGALSVADCCVQPEARAFWIHEYASVSRQFDARLAGAPGATFQIAGVNLGRDWGLLGLGLAVQWRDRVRAGINYDFYVTPNAAAHGGMGQVQISW